MGQGWWPHDADELECLQRELAEHWKQAPFWRPALDGPPRVGGVFLASRRGYTGAGAEGDPAWAAAAVLEGDRVIDSQVVVGVSDAPYAAGLLALREGRLLGEVVAQLRVRPDVLLVNATGRDHPRRAGLALHLGAACDLPSIGVTDRPLIAQPVDDELRLDDEVVAYRLRTQPGARPVIVHSGWRVSAETARTIVLQVSRGGRTPAPLRAARRLARTSRGHLG